MDDEIIHSWCFQDVEYFDSTPSAAIIILDKALESFSSLRSQQGSTDIFVFETFKTRKSLRAPIESGRLDISVCDKSK